MALNLDHGSQRMEYGNQRMDYEDTDVKHERTVFFAPNIRILGLYSLGALNGVGDG